MKIYTKKGDLGQTSLFGGQRVDKFHHRVEAYGEIDELISALGVAASWSEDKELVQLIETLQMELFFLSSELATPEGKVNKSERVEAAHIDRLEKEIDRCDSELPPLRSFILPGGSPVSTMLHLARSVSRRAERRVVLLSTQEEVRAEVLGYLNRLSDLLFNLGRVANLRENKEDVLLSEIRETAQKV